MKKLLFLLLTTCAVQIFSAGGAAAGGGAGGGAAGGGAAARSFTIIFKDGSSMTKTALTSSRNYSNIFDSLKLDKSWGTPALCRFKGDNWFLVEEMHDGRYKQGKTATEAELLRYKQQSTSPMIPTALSPEILDSLQQQAEIDASTGENKYTSDDYSVDDLTVMLGNLEFNTNVYIRSGNAEIVRKIYTTIVKVKRALEQKKRRSTRAKGITDEIWANYIDLGGNPETDRDFLAGMIAGGMSLRDIVALSNEQ